MSDVQGQEEPGGGGAQEARSRSGRIWQAVAVILAALLSAGAVWGQLSGYGVFGYRLVLYGENDLYVLNLEDEARYVSVEGGELKEVVAGGARLLRVVGGEATVEAFDEDREFLESWTLVSDRSHTFLNLSEHVCIAISKIGGLPDGDEVVVEIKDWLEPGTTLYPLDTRMVLWPRMEPGALEYGEGPPRVVSIEPADCTLSEDDDFLAEYLQRRIAERLAAPEP